MFLRGDITEMVKRAKQKFRIYEQEDLEKQQEALMHLAKGAATLFPDAVAFVDVTNKSIEQVAKEVSEIIYFGNYTEVEFQIILNTIERKGRRFHEA